MGAPLAPWFLESAKTLAAVRKAPGVQPSHSAQAVPIIGYLDLVNDESLIAEAGRRLSEAAPDARVILFGSHARGDARPGSDLDLLVVEPEMKSRRAEFVRLREALGAMSVPIDLIVVSADHAERWGPVPGTLMHEALRDGRVIAGT